jgi:hypothetical protein
VKQYDDLKATYLFCNNCGGSMPVKERLLLILPDGYLYIRGQKTLPFGSLRSPFLRTILSEAKDRARMKN